MKTQTSTTADLPFLPAPTLPRYALRDIESKQYLCAGPGDSLCLWRTEAAALDAARNTARPDTRHGSPTPLIEFVETCLTVPSNSPFRTFYDYSKSEYYRI